ncbi:MAG: DUF5009 domain-containing protein [Verrucomicrobia bacterium]|nr:DUF5009 domain-containing protein [Verrucomicrobiota bacterium]
MSAGATSGSAAPTAADAPGQRLMSLDALRGFDMFWILGGDVAIRTASTITQAPGADAFSPLGWLAAQFSHKDWAGFAFYDLIFPLFVFIAGVSLVWSLTKERELHGRAGALKRVARRAALLFLLGIFYSGGLTREWPDIRLLGVLQRIALCYLFAGLIFCFFNVRAMAAIAAGLLLGYWALMGLAPVRDIQLNKPDLAKLCESRGDAKGAALFQDAANPSAAKHSAAWAKAREMFDATTARTGGTFEPGRNLSNHLDFQFLPGRKYDTFYDPEGILSTLPAIVTCLLGVFAGLFLRSSNFTDSQKVNWLLAAGAAGVALGFAWGLAFPVVKKIWTSSYVLVAGGYSALLLAAFYYVVDVRQWRTWCRPFVWIGVNSITIYVANNLLQFRTVAARFAGGDVKKFLDTRLSDGAGNLFITLLGFALIFWFVHFLYKRRIFLRL